MPKFCSTPAHKNDRFLELFWCELLVYKPFRDFHKDIGEAVDDIIQNWKNFHRDPLLLTSQESPSSILLGSEEVSKDNMPFL